LQAAITLVPEDPGAAEDVLLRLSGLLRISLGQMDANDIPLARELEFLDLYIGIQKRRFGERLGFEIQADQAALGARVPPLILQPLVENAIRHGIGKHKGDDQWWQAAAGSCSWQLRISIGSRPTGTMRGFTRASRLRRSRDAAGADGEA